MALEFEPNDGEAKLLACDCSGGQAVNDAWAKPEPKRKRHFRQRDIAPTLLDEGQEHNAKVVDAPIPPIKIGDEELMLWGSAGSSLHGHYDRDDGMGTVESIVQKAIEQNIAFIGITPHSHKDCRKGVPPDDPRAKDQKGKPTIAEDPQAFLDLRRAAEKVNHEGKVTLIIGQELGTVGSKCDAKTAANNHTLLLGSDTLFITDLEGDSQAFRVSRFLSASDKLKAASGEQKTFNYHVADGKKFLEGLRNSPGLIGLCHPRRMSGRGICDSDYFKASYNTENEWSEEYMEPHGRLVGVLSGMALKPEPVKWMDPNMLDLTPAFGYNDVKRTHLAFHFERDFHYGDPGGRPAGMGVLVRRKNDKGLLEGVDRLRSFVSTAYDDLQAVTIANDKYVMGSIINPADIDKLRFKVLIGGKIDLNAKYRAKLWADTNIGDRSVAQIVDERTMSGSELLDNHQQMSFDNVKYQHNNGNAFVVEIEREVGQSADGRSKIDVKAATTTIWVEPTRTPAEAVRKTKK